MESLENFFRLILTTIILASSITAGLAASLVKVARLGELKNDNGTPVPDTVAGIRGYIMNKSWSRGPETFRDGTHDRNGIWNGFDLNQGACKWNPNNPLRQRRQDGAVCEIPLPSTTGSTEVSSTTSEPSSTSESAAMPTLTNAPVGTITTPDGSSCAGTSTSTQCAIGPGGKTACAEFPSCFSWVNTMTTSEPEPEPTETEIPETPLQLKDVVCEDENDFPGHGDVSPQSQAGYAESFCGGDLAESRSKTLGPDDDPMEELKRDGGDISYNYSISWIEGCKTEVDKQYIQWPIGEEDRFSSCSQIFSKAYGDCEYPLF